MKDKKNYTVRSIRISEPLWEDLRLHRLLTKLSWNRLLRRMLAADKEVNKLNRKNHEL